MRNLIFLLMMPVILAGCSGRDDLSDAYGNFESIEYLISAEGQGKILDFSPREGDKLLAGQRVGYIDTIPLHLQRVQLVAKLQSIEAQKESVRASISVQETQKKTLMVEKDRLERLLTDGAATGKQMDDLTGQLNKLESQILATRTNYVTIESEIKAMRAQIIMLDDQISRNSIINPINGTVLEKYAEPFEMTSAGKILYKIADLESMILRVYVSGDQLSGIRIGQQVRVLIDDPDQPELEGKITWVSDKSEFTPKIIQTREERVNLVYAVKVEVPNDGRLKIGMPGEVILLKEAD